MAEINEKLLEDVRKVAALPLPWEQLDHKQIVTIQNHPYSKMKSG